MRLLADLLADGDLRGKRVLVRSDLNVPLDGQTITDDGRIKASVPAIEALAEAGATVVADRAAVERDVQVRPDEDALALQPAKVVGQLVDGDHRVRGWSRRS